MNKKEIVHFLSRFKATHQAKYQIRKIGIFGSAARDELQKNSDIDVVVEIEEPDLFALIAIKQDIEEQLHRPVDIIRYRANMNAFLKSRIDREAVYV
jgi:predicted nucleotidyltransferase